MAVEPDIYSHYIAIGISLTALGVTIWTFSRKQKSEAFRIALDLNSKIKEQSDEIVEACSSNEPPEKIRYKELEYLNTWEFFAFLVNKGELKNENILNYFKPAFISGVEDTLKDYPDVAKNTNVYEEIRTRLEKWGHKIQIKEDSPKASTT
jgi:hypothetical protein